MSETLLVKSFIYILQHATEPRIKIGRSIRPGSRAYGLQDAINYKRSFQVAVSNYRANQIEATLHGLVQACAVAPDHHADGYTEWFDDRAIPIVKQFVERNPGLFEDGGFVKLDESELKKSARFTERQWQQLRAHMFKHEVTFQALVIDALADKVEKFDR